MKQHLLMAIILTASCSLAQADNPAADTSSQNPSESTNASTNANSDSTQPNVSAPNTPAIQTSKEQESSTQNSAAQPNAADQPSSQSNVSPTNDQSVAQQQAAMPEKIDCDLKIPADQKEVGQDTVKNWAKQAAVQTFTMQANSVDEQLKALKKCFTNEGWTGYKNALDKSGNLESIKKENLNVSSSVTGNATVEMEKDDQWNVVIPLTVTYKNEKNAINQNLNVKLLVAREKDGTLGIMQVIASPQKLEAAQDTRQTGTTQKPDASETQS